MRTFLFVNLFLVCCVAAGVCAWLGSKPTVEEPAPKMAPFDLDLDLDLDPRRHIRNAGVRYRATDGRHIQVTVHTLLAMSPDQLERLPEWRIEVISALVADGLPGYDTERDGVAAAMRVGDLAAEIATKTRKDMPIFHRAPDQFQGSEARFRMAALITYLRRDYGIAYDPEWAVSPGTAKLYDLAKETVNGDTFWKAAKRLFLYGTFQGNGTCSSLPVLTVAIARSLGYPVKLVAAKNHLFARWDTPSEKFNIECTGEGYAFYDDQYYKSWPEEVTEDEIRKLGLLKSMSRADELAMLLHARALCLRHNGRSEESYVWVAKALELQAQHERRQEFIVKCMRSRFRRSRNESLDRKREAGHIGNADAWQQNYNEAMAIKERMERLIEMDPEHAREVNARADYVPAWTETIWTEGSKVHYELRRVNGSRAGVVYQYEQERSHSSKLSD